MIELKNISKEYYLKNDEKFFAVKNVDLTIDDNEIVGIVGYSGAGKSTLLRLMNLLITPNTGTVAVDSKDLLSLSKNDLNIVRHNMGMVFQNFNLLNQLTVYENIKLSLDISKYVNNKYERVIVESSKDNPYVNILAVLKGREKLPKIQALVEVLTSETIKTFISNNYQGSVIPA